MKKNKIYIKSYGCQMNVYDSNRILDLFKNQNYEIADDPNLNDVKTITLSYTFFPVEKKNQDKGEQKVSANVSPLSETRSIQ